MNVSFHRCVQSFSLFLFVFDSRWTIADSKYLAIDASLVAPQALVQRLTHSGHNHSVLESFVLFVVESPLRLLLHVFRDLFHVDRILHSAAKGRRVLDFNKDLLADLTRPLRHLFR